jgi:hypothetical protein
MTAAACRGVDTWGKPASTRPADCPQERTRPERLEVDNCRAPQERTHPLRLLERPVLHRWAQEDCPRRCDRKRASPRTDKCHHPRNARLARRAGCRPKRTNLPGCTPGRSNKPDCTRRRTGRRNRRSRLGTSENILGLVHTMPPDWRSAHAPNRVSRLAHRTPRAARAGACARCASASTTRAASHTRDEVAR